MKLTGTINEAVVEIDTEINFMYIYLPQFDLVKEEDFFSNTRVLSEQFRDHFGIGPAADFLIKHKVPRDHPLWYLGEHCKWQEFANNYRKGE